MWQTTHNTEIVNVIITERVRRAARQRRAKQVSAGRRASTR